ncbi:MAG: hypothetical protein NZM04_00425 [Methylacidiphilales bacterium]|nr:hypothetical protein [Candidatus Methylacidiphilales bacterium]
MAGRQLNSSSNAIERIKEVARGYTSNPDVAERAATRAAQLLPYDPADPYWHYNLLLLILLEEFRLLHDQAAMQQLIQVAHETAWPHKSKLVLFTVRIAIATSSIAVAAALLAGIIIGKSL